MIIVSRKMTVRDLLAQLDGADLDQEVTFSRPSKKVLVACWCGCGGMTKGKFVPGHDSKFHGSAKRVARGQEEHAEATANLPHAEALAEFDRWVADEQPVWRLKEQQKAEAKAERERVKEEAEAEKAEFAVA